MNTSQYNKCVESSADNLYRFVLGIVRRQDEAEDVVQESFARFWENRSKIERGKEKNYLFTIAYRLAISELRTRNRKHTEELLISQYVEDEEYDNMTELLWNTLDSMGETQRSVIMLCDWEGYSYGEIAEITQMSLSMVKVTIHRARTIIKERLENEYRS